MGYSPGKGQADGQDIPGIITHTNVESAPEAFEFLLVIQMLPGLVS